MIDSGPGTRQTVSTSSSSSHGKMPKARTCLDCLLPPLLEFCNYLQLPLDSKLNPAQLLCFISANSSFCPQYLHLCPVRLHSHFSFAHLHFEQFFFVLNFRQRNACHCLQVIPRSDRTITSFRPKITTFRQGNPHSFRSLPHPFWYLPYLGGKPSSHS